MRVCACVRVCGGGVSVIGGGVCGVLVFPCAFSHRVPPTECGICVCVFVCVCTCVWLRYACEWWWYFPVLFHSASFPAVCGVTSDSFEAAKRDLQPQ